MYIVAGRDLAHSPQDIAVLPSGEVLVLSWSPAGLHLDSYDEDFALVWHRDLGKDALGLSVDGHGVPWIVDRRGVSALTGQGDVWHRVTFVPPDGMDVSAFTAVDEDVIFACQHATDAKPCEPLLARVSADGSVRWLSTLFSDWVNFDGDQTAFRIGGPWVPQDWVNSYFVAGTMTTSGDVLFVPYTDMPATAWGLGYVVDVANGNLRYTTGVTTHDQVTAMNDRAFLVGCGGQTTLYDGEGRQKAQWNTGGIHVVRPGDIRVLEMDTHVPSQSRIAGLMPDGSVIRGDLIDGLQTSQPYVEDDGTIIFVRNGMLTTVQDLAIIDRQFIHRSDEYDIMSTRVLPVADGLVTSHSRYLRNARGGFDQPMRHMSGLVRIRF